MSEGELRAMVREVLREALAARGAPAARSPSSTLPHKGEEGASSQGIARGGDRVVEAVRIGSDAELAAFVRRLAGLMADPASAAAVRDGRHRFTLASPVAGSRAAVPPALPPPSWGRAGEEGRTGATATAATAAATVTLTGTITEAKVAKLPPESAAVLAPGAVMTPLARDRARAMRIRIERRR